MPNTNLLEEYRSPIHSDDRHRYQREKRERDGEGRQRNYDIEGALQAILQEDGLSARERFSLPTSLPPRKRMLWRPSVRSGARPPREERQIDPS
ncbi:MAG: hypothetical protein M3N07_00100 [Pseudomonadota bacterium]|nr:hypothetical protein [Pseudomonadota bacterium]